MSDTFGYYSLRDRIQVKLQLTGKSCLSCQLTTYISVTNPSLLLIFLNQFQSLLYSINQSINHVL